MTMQEQIKELIVSEGIGVIKLIIGGTWLIKDKNRKIWKVRSDYKTLAKHKHFRYLYKD